MKRLTINGQVADISELPSAISFKYVDIIDGLSNRYSPSTSGIIPPLYGTQQIYIWLLGCCRGSKKVNPNLIRNGYRMKTGNGYPFDQQDNIVTDSWQNLYIFGKGA